MQDKRNRALYKTMAENDPQKLLAGDVPRLIDEWQVAPSLWDSIRHEVDLRDGEVGQFLLTGSAVPPDDSEIEHGGAGRIATCVMRPMSLFESGESSGDVSLGDLFDGKVCFGESPLELEDYAFAVCRGGWPATIGRERRAALRMTDNFYDTLVTSDMSRIDGIQRPPQRVRRIMASYARLCTTQANYQTIIADMAANEPETVSAVTLASYLDALHRLYIVEDLPAWTPNLLSKTRLRTTDTRHFVDPSIACSAIKATPSWLMNQLTTFGSFFESLAIRDLRIYADAIDGSVYHYRDNNGLECDAVVELRDGRSGLVEVKLYDSDGIDEGAANLLKLASLINDKVMRKPSFLAVVTGTKTAYLRDDGVYVIPLGCLKP